MAVVGSAEVVVRAITTQVKRDIEKAFKDAGPSIKAAGDQAGRDFADSFGKSAGSNMKGSLDSAFSNIDASRYGDKAGKDFADGAASGIGGGGGRIGSAAERALGGAGSRGGGAFGRTLNKALNSAWASAAQQASQNFTRLFAGANIAGVAIAGLVSSLSAAVSGLFAMASAASVAAGSLAVLPGIIGVAAQSMGALRLAFSGLGEAVSAGMEPAAAASGAAAKQAVDNTAAIANARRGIADAERNLARARTDAAQAMFDADRQVADAARGVAAAEQELLNVTRQLNDARREAAETLQQLAFSAEDAALAEDRALLNLEDAFAAYQAVKDLPADDRSRREAELSYKEAELAYRQAKDNNADMAKEQRKAAKAGIEGSEEVLDVRRQIADAEEGVNDAERALADARMARARQAQDNARAIADAQRALAQAQAGLTQAQADTNDATIAGAAAVDKYAEAMAKLSPQAQSFVKYLVSLQDEFQGLKDAAGAELFPRLERALRPIVAQLFPVLEEQLRRTGRIWGDYAIGVSNALTRGNLFEKLLRSQNQTMDVFNRRGENGRTVIDDMTTVALRLMNAIQPLTRRFARWIATLVEGWEAATDTQKEMRKLGNFFDLAGDRAALLGDIIKNLFGVFVGLGKAGDKAGEGLLKSLNRYFRELNKFVNSPKGREKLEGYFDGVARNMRALGNLTRAVGRAFGRLGDNKGVSDFATGIEPAIENFGKLADNLTKAGGGPLAEFITKLSEIALALGDTSGIEIFFDVINDSIDLVLGSFDLVGKAIDAVFGEGSGKKVFILVTGLLTFLRTMSFVQKMGSKLFQVLLGGPIGVLKALVRLRKDGLGGVTKALGLMKPASDEAKDALEKQMITDKAKTEILEALERQARDTAAAMGILGEKGLPTDVPNAAAAVDVPDVDAPDLDLGLDTAVADLDAFDRVSNDIAVKKPSVFKRMGGAIGGSFKKMGSGISALVGGPFGLLLMAIPLLIKGFTLLFKKSPEFRAFVTGITKAVGPVVKAIGTWLLGVLSKLFGWINRYMPTIRRVVADTFTAISGFVSRVLIPAFQKAWTIIRPILGFLWKAVQFAFTAIKFYITKILIPAWTLVFKIFRTAWNIIRPILGFLWKAVKFAFSAIKMYVTKILIPYIQLVFRIFKTAWSIIRPILGLLWKTIQTVFNIIKGLVTRILLPIIQRLWNAFKTFLQVVKDVFNGVRNAIGTAVTFIKTKFGDFKNALSDIWGAVKSRVNDIKTKFGEIVGSVRDAFGNLASKAVGPLNAFIRFLNDKLIGNVNKITSKFGLTISDIPTVSGFAKGGYTGRMSPKAVAGLVHGDEHVIRSSSRRKIERSAPGALDYMNKTGRFPTVEGGTGGIDLWPGDAPDLGLGKLRDLAGATIGGIKDIGEEIAKSGLGKVLETLVKGATGLMGAAGIKRGSFMNDFFYAIMDKLASYAKDWGGKSGDQPGGSIPTPGSAGTYNGPPGGWTHPMYSGAPVTQWPNEGHNPWWSIDFDGETGDAIRAASRGIVTLATSIAGSYGTYVKIAHADGITTLYAHLSQILVRLGQKVRTGQLIGRMGSTGNSSGSHLHFETVGRDSAAFLRARGVRLARGGIVQATPGGILANIGEAGRNERVEPLAYDGFSSRDRAMIDLIKQSIAAGQGGGKGDTFHVHPAPGMNEAELAQMVSRRVAWRRSVGT